MSDPLPSNTVDVIISNCASISRGQRKGCGAFRPQPGGRFRERNRRRGDMPAEVRRSMSLDWVRGRALEETGFPSLLRRLLREPIIEPTLVYTPRCRSSLAVPVSIRDREAVDGQFIYGFVRATNPSSKAAHEAAVAPTTAALEDIE